MATPSCLCLTPTRLWGRQVLNKEANRVGVFTTVHCCVGVKVGRGDSVARAGPDRAGVEVASEFRRWGQPWTPSEEGIVSQDHQPGPRP